MSTLFAILIVLVCIILSFFVLIQNPKGGGLSGTFGGLGTSTLGHKQSTDAVEKGTWYSILGLVVLVILSFVMMPKGGKVGKETDEFSVGSGQPTNIVPSSPATAPANGNTAPASPSAPGDNASSPSGQATPAPAPEKK